MSDPAAHYTAMAVLPSQNLVVMGTQNGHLELHRTSGKRLQDRKVHEDKITSLTPICFDSGIIAEANGGELFFTPAVLNLNSAPEELGTRCTPVHTTYIVARTPAARSQLSEWHAVAWSNSVTTLFCCTELLHPYSKRSGKPIHTIQEDSPASSIQLIQHDRTLCLLIGSCSGKISLWKVSEREEPINAFRFRLGQTPTTAINCYNLNARRLFFWAANGPTLTAWSSKEDQRTITQNPSKSVVFFIQNIGSMTITCSRMGHCALFRDGKQSHTLKLPSKRKLRSLSVEPLGKEDLLIATNPPTGVRLWNSRTGESKYYKDLNHTRWLGQLGPFVVVVNGNSFTILNSSYFL